MDISIKKLVNISTHDLEKISSWMYEWWGKNEGYGFDAIKAYMQHSLQEERLPQTYGLFVGEDIAGIYQFRLDDLFVRPDIYPWFANFYVDIPYRNKGIAKAAMMSLKDNARDCLDCNEIYLYTTHNGFYEKFGWEFVSETDTHINGRRIQRLYKLDLEHDRGEFRI